MDRAQAYTLEGTIAAIVIVIAALYGIQAIDAGPWSGSPSEEPDRLSTQAADFLSVTAADGTLRDTVLCTGMRNDATDGGAIHSESSRFERQLNHSFDRQGRAYILHVYHWSGDDGRERKVLSSTDENTLAAPPEDAGSATHRHALYDDDRVRINDGNADCAEKGPPLTGPGSISSFYADDVNPDSELYNVVEVRLLVW